MIVEIKRGSGHDVEIAETETRYDRFFEEEREVQTIEISSLDDLLELLDEDFVVATGGGTSMAKAPAVNSKELIFL